MPLPIPDPFPFDPSDPLERIPTKSGVYQGESTAANQALRDYCALGPRRSVALLLERYDRIHADKEQTVPTLSRPTMTGWSVKYAWVKRAEIYDRQEAERMQAELRARQMDIVERDWDQANRLRDLAEAILEAAPEFIESTEKMVGGKIVVTKKLDGNLLIKLVETGSKLARLSAGMSTDKKSVELTTDIITQLPDDVLELVAAGKITEEDLLKIVAEES